MHHRSKLREYFESLLVSIIVVLFIRAFVAEAVQIPTGSMEDTLLPGDHLFINKLTYRQNIEIGSYGVLPFADVRRRDIVVFRFFDQPDESRYYVKRIIGLPGDRVEIRAKQVYIDGKALDESYAVFKEPWAKDRQPHDDMELLEIPLGHYFVMGDNRDRSYDSRFWGPLPRDRIIGKPLVVWWSFDGNRTPASTRWTDRLGGLFTRFFRQTRWRRTGLLID